MGRIKHSKTWVIFTFSMVASVSVILTTYKWSKQQYIFCSADAI